MTEINVRDTKAARAGRPERLAPLVGLAGQTSGETVAQALAARKNRNAESTDEADLYARRLGRTRPVVLRAAGLLWSALVGAPLPAAYAARLELELAEYGSEVEAMSPELTAQTVRGTLGRVPQLVYAAFDPQPFGVGPASQVHSAVLHDGRWVAVKIRYRGLSQAVRSALATPELQQALAPLVREAAGEQAAARIHTVAGELRGRVEQLVGLKAEAALQAQLAAEYRRHPHIRVPGVIQELSTERVLTMELAVGRSWAQAVQADAAERNRWAQALYRFADSARIALDPGPGNYLFHDDGRVTVLGFGSERIDPEHAAARARRAPAVAEHDRRALHALHAEHCGYEHSGDDPERLWAWHSQIRGPLTGSGATTCTPEWSADVAEAVLPAHRPCTTAHQAPKSRPECPFAGAADTGLAAVLAGLRATADWNAIRTEHEGAEAPATTTAPEARTRLAGGTDGEAR